MSSMWEYMEENWMYSMLKEIEKHLDRWEEKKEVVTAVMVVAVAMEVVEVVEDMEEEEGAGDDTPEVEVAVLVVAEVHLSLAREVKTDAEVPRNPEVHVDQLLQRPHLVSSHHAIPGADRRQNLHDNQDPDLNL